MRPSPLALLLVLLSFAGEARADAIDGPPACPPGSRGRSAHEGQWCVAASCDAGCEAGETCRDYRVCVVTASVTPGGLRPSEPPPEDRDLVVATCEPSAACTGTEEPPPPTVGVLPAVLPTCVTTPVCVPTPRPSLPSGTAPAPAPSASPSTTPTPATTPQPPSSCLCSTPGARTASSPLPLLALALALFFRRLLRRPLALSLPLSLALSLLSPAPTSAQDPPLPAGWSRVTRVFSSTPTALACTADTAFVREWGGSVTAFDGQSGTRLPQLTQSAYGNSIAVDADGHPTLVASDGIVTYGGSAWSALRGQPWDLVPVDPHEGEIRGLLVLDDTHRYFVTDGAIGALDGDHYALYDIGSWRRFEAIAGRSPSDLWAVGQGGTVMHWDGSTWTREATNTEAWLRGVALGPSDVWVWSERVILHRDASGWPTVSIGSPVGNLTSLVVSPRAVLVVGDGGVARWDGHGFVPELPASATGTYASFGPACATDRFLAVALTNGDVLTRSL